MGLALVAAAGSPSGVSLARAEADPWDLAQFGHRVIGLPDIDGDGAPDFVVSAPGVAVSAGGTGVSRVIAMSAKDGTTLWTATGPCRGEQGLGWSLAAIGDLDGDSVGDIAAFCPVVRAMEAPSDEVWILSGRTGKRLRTLRGEEGSSPFGEELAGVGDQDADGVPDIAATGTIAREGGTPGGGVLVFSGRSGRVIRRLDGGSWLSRMEAESGTRVGGFVGTSVCAAGDWDGRGTGDIAIGGFDGKYEGLVLIAAGEDGCFLRTLRAGRRYGGFARGLYPGPASPAGVISEFLVFSDSFQDDDLVDGGAATRVVVGSDALPAPWKGIVGLDAMEPSSAWVRGGGGTPRLIVGAGAFANEGDRWEGRLFVFGEGTSTALYQVPDPSPGQLFGHSVATIADMDGDGVEEILAGAPWFTGSAEDAARWRGRVYLFSGGTGNLISAFGPNGLEPVARDDVLGLLGELDTGDAEVRESVLRRVAGLRVPDLRPLVSLVEGDGGESGRSAVLEVLRALGMRAAPAVPAVRARLGEALARQRESGQAGVPDAEIDAAIAFLCSPALRASVPDGTLLEILDSSPGPARRREVFSALRARGLPVESVLPRVLPCLVDPDPSARVAGFEVLASFPPPATAVAEEVRVRALRACLSDGPMEERCAAAALLGAWRIDASNATESLLRLVRIPAEGRSDAGTNDTILGLAKSLARGLHGDLDPVLAGLESCLESGEVHHRVRAVVVLACVRFEKLRQVEAVLSHLQDASKDPDPAVVDAAARAEEILAHRARAR